MKIGFIGLGIMGESMCENIVKKHDDKVYVFDFVKEKVDQLAALGAIPCNSTLEVAENVDVLISMVPKSEHSKAVYGEALPAMGPGKICIDMSTIDPSVSLECGRMVGTKGAQWADAPVVKSKPAAINGTLGILVGCDESLYPVIEPILRYMGCNVIRMGGNGKGLVMKICHNALVSQIQNGVNETITLAKANGITIPAFAEAVSYGGASNWYLDGQAAKLEAEDYTTAFSIENMAKDVNICVNLAKECGVKMPGEENALNVYQTALDRGMAKEDFRATIKVVRDR